MSLLLVFPYNREGRFYLISVLLVLFVKESAVVLSSASDSGFLFSFLFPLSVFVLSCYLPAPLFWLEKINLSMCTGRRDISGVLLWWKGYCCLHSESSEQTEVICSSLGLSCIYWYMYEFCLCSVSDFLSDFFLSFQFIDQYNTQVLPVEPAMENFLNIFWGFVIEVYV